MRGSGQASADRFGLQLLPEASDTLKYTLTPKAQTIPQSHCNLWFETKWLYRECPAGDHAGETTAPHRSLGSCKVGLYLISNALKVPV